MKLACATALGAAGVAVTQVNRPQVTVNAATTSVAARALGVDVASYQSADLSSHAQAGSQFAIVKVSEGTSYRNPKASNQISTAISNNTFLSVINIFLSCLSSLKRPLVTK